MRKLTDHIVNPCNDMLQVYALDGPGPGGASHQYSIGWGDENDLTGHSEREGVIQFQNGPINEVGVNGVTHEALLSILIDRLRGFQSGPFACRDNDMALARLEEAQMWLQRRTLERMRRGVEGTNVK